MATDSARIARAAGGWILVGPASDYFGDCGLHPEV